MLDAFSASNLVLLGSFAPLQIMSCNDWSSRVMGLLSPWLGHFSLFLAHWNMTLPLHRRFDFASPNPGLRSSSLAALNEGSSQHTPLAR